MSNDMIKMLATGLKTQTEQHNTLADEIGALTGDRTKLVHDRITDENTEDETIQTYQEWLDAAQAELEAQATAIRAYVADKYLPAIDETAVESKRTEMQSLAAQIKAARKFASTIPGFKDEDLAEVPPLKNLRGGTAGGGTGSKRPRFNRISYRIAGQDEWIAVETTKDVKGESVIVTNLSLLAITLKDVFKHKVEVKDLQAAAFAEAGTDDLSTLGGTVLEFGFTVGETNIEVQAEPKAPTDA